MKTIKSIFIKCLIFLALISPLFATGSAYAQCTSENSPTCGGPSGNTNPVASGACNNTEDAKGNVSQSKVNKCINQSPVVKDIQNIVNFLSAAVGVVIIAMIIVGGIQYSLAGDNASALGAAKQRITNAMIALFAFLFAFAFLQWLIPGGIFG
ncbi:hypothetical protein KW792_01085 [Candidatus Saccharibacteria bacterium]|nr:hypothetical protein [Candidatus Saccharibacteria bacterium]